MKKFELTSEFITTAFGKKLFRIRALISFGNVEKGELGGYVEKKENLSQEGNAWVFGNARVYGNARVSDDAMVFGNAWVFGDAWVSDDARVFGDAWVSDDARVYGDALLKKQSDVLSVANIGSRNDVTTFFMSKEGVIKVKCGCFYDNIDEFAKKVHETHAGTIYEKQYNAAIELAKISILRESYTDVNTSEDKPKVYNGKLICVRSSADVIKKHKFIKGKVYEVVEGFLIIGNMKYGSNDLNTEPFISLEQINEIMYPNFIEMVEE